VPARLTEQKFSMPWGERLAPIVPLLLAAILFSALGRTSAHGRLLDLIVIYGLGSFGLVVTAIWLVMNANIIIDEDGIASILFGVRLKSIPWPKVANFYLFSFINAVGGRRVVAFCVVPAGRGGRFRTIVIMHKLHQRDRAVALIQNKLHQFGLVLEERS
jgi:hypothetical protein